MTLQDKQRVYLLEIRVHDLEIDLKHVHRILADLQLLLDEGLRH